eukprot:CAMPEP_0197067236 /NCGR_PEP_ID=MMETSP1384-20130603/178861_1 /TAXON_ID=29189 /ORGANISM="Ammonia sp." /LENGTH=84 /DNA_ID=CAMNT_0042504627 /DNA_START=1 /DNA_END=252 /DNA_ORIENTATION=+
MAATHSEEIIEMSPGPYSRSPSLDVDDQSSDTRTPTPPSFAQNAYSFSVQKQDLYDAQSKSLLFMITDNDVRSIMQYLAPSQRI